MKKFFIGIIILIAIFVIAYFVFIKEKNDVLGSTIVLTEGTEGVVIGAFQANYASVSFSADDDIISYSTDAPTVASVSAGDIIIFEGGALEPVGITEGFAYYVVTASVSSGFEIASVSTTKTPLDLQAAGEGAEFFYEQPNSNVFNVQGFEKITIDVDFSGTTVSTSLNFVGSISNDAPSIFLSKSATNAWDNIAVFDLQNNTEVEGDTGLVDTVAADHRIFEVYAKNLTWISAFTDSLEAGIISVKIKGQK